MGCCCGKTYLVDALKTRLAPGDRVVVAGKRGSGKTAFVQRLREANPGLVSVDLDTLNRSGWPVDRSRPCVVEAGYLCEFPGSWGEGATKVFMAKEPNAAIRNQTFSVLARAGMVGDTATYKAKHTEALTSKIPYCFVLAGSKPPTPRPGRC